MCYHKDSYKTLLVDSGGTALLGARNYGGQSFKVEGGQGEGGEPGE